MSRYMHAFLKLREDYRKAAVTEEELDKVSPIKEVEVLHCVDGIPSETLTHMHGEAMDGLTVDKVIYVNDSSNSTDDDVTLFDRRHHALEHYHNDGLTRLRCGLMTCVALSEAMSLMKLPEIRRVGIIGNGRTNQQNAECICDIFGVRELVIRGSARDRGKNRAVFESFCPDVMVDDTDDLALLNTCGAVVSCTSTVDKNDQISASLLYGPKIMIALDTGYLLDESFRKECEAFADDVDQLEAYYKEEFIFDEGHVHLRQLMNEKTVTKDRLCIYMFGISFADAEVAEMRHNHEVE